MTRSVALIAHVAALPVAALLSVALAITFPSSAAIDIHMHDTFFVVAHFHFSILLGACALITTFVAYRYGVVNPLVGASWALFVIHAIAAIVQRRHASALAPEPGSVAIAYPDQAGVGYIYLGSALAGLAVVALALVVSLWQKLRGQAQRG